ncbi:MAG TPA: hypothetical protein V6D12_00335 [Candidatus Obscuribacterales bacterium]
MESKESKEIDIVQLRVDVPTAFRSRLKALSARMGITMGELVVKLSENQLRELEKQFFKDVEH